MAALAVATSSSSSPSAYAASPTMFSNEYTTVRDFSIAPVPEDIIQSSLDWARANPTEGFPLIVPKPKYDENGNILQRIEVGHLVWLYSHQTNALVILGRVISKVTRVGFSMHLGSVHHKNASTNEDVLFMEADSLVLTSMDMNNFRLNYINQIKGNRPPSTFICLSEEPTYFLKMRMQAVCDSDLFRKLAREFGSGNAVGVNEISAAFPKLLADLIKTLPQRNTKVRAAFDFSQLKSLKSAKRSGKDADEDELSAKIQWYKPTAEMIETRDFAGIEAGMLKKMAEIEQHGSFMECDHFLPFSPLIVARHFPERLATMPYYKPFRDALSFAVGAPRPSSAAAKNDKSATS